MASTEREQRLQFLNLTARDEQLLRDLRPLLEAHLTAIVEGFYAHLLGIAEPAQLLRNAATIERLKQLQREYLLRLTAGNFDEDYVAARRAIGRTHERVGLSPQWYLLAYSHHLATIAPLVREAYRDDPDRAQASILALEKVFMLDASLAIDAYIASDRYRHLQQLESIVNDSADVIFLLDTEKRFRAWNRAAEQIFGWPAEEIIGQHVSAAGAARPGARRASWSGLTTRSTRRGHYHLETVRVAKDGRRVPVELSAVGAARSAGRDDRALGDPARHYRAQTARRSQTPGRTAGRHRRDVGQARPRDPQPAQLDHAEHRPGRATRSTR